MDPVSVTAGKQRLFLTLAILFISMLLVALLIATRPEAKTEIKQAAITRVEVVQVRVEDLQPQVELTGVLRPRQLASLRFEVAGEVMSRQVEPGQSVAAGDLLLALSVQVVGLGNPQDHQTVIIRGHQGSFRGPSERKLMITIVICQVKSY